jgi:putative ABC transport system ATP-binding protein
MYRLTAVTRNYQKGQRRIAALRDVSLTIADGDWLVVQGRTGHGKSTLPQVLGALDKPSSGSVKFGDLDLARMREAQLAHFRTQKVGFVFQNFNLIPTLSAVVNVEAGLVPLRMRPPERRRRAAAALESVGLGDRAHHLPSELSGGQQQRVAIARALAKEPTVLLADEPTGNLDEQTRDEVINLLEALWRERGSILALVTHDSTAARRAPRVVALDRGRLAIRHGARR